MFTHLPFAPNRLFRGLVCAAVASLVVLPAAHADDYDGPPPTVPDFSGNPSAPSAVSFILGDNFIQNETGRDTSGVVDRDYFTVTIPKHRAISAIELLKGTTFLGAKSLSFIGVVEGSTVPDPSTVTAPQLLGYHHFGPSEIGTDILPAIGEGAGAQGFTGLLRKGTYSFWVQETASGISSYNFNFKVIAVPDQGQTLWMGLGAMSLTVAASRRWKR